MIRACFHTFVFAAYPVLFVAGTIAGMLPIEGAVVARSLVVAVACTFALLALLRPLVPDLATRAACLSFFFIGFDLYTVTGSTSNDARIAVLYTLGIAAAAVLIVRPWTRRKRTPTPLNVAACVLIAANLYAVAPVLRSKQPWRPAADTLIGDVVNAAGTPAPGAKPDIYYIVLDGFGRSDILRELYQLDLGPFVKALEARGFAVPEAGHSNYAQTFLSLGSSLNLSYLDPVAGVMAESGDRRALEYLIQHNALATLARRAGYRVVVIGSDYMATERVAGADECFCEQYGMREFEVSAINLTPLRALPLGRWTYDAHRRKVEQAFRHLEDAAHEAAPKLVFAHVLSPHPPFVFQSDGSPRDNARMFGFFDGSHFHGPRAEYVSGYRDQAQFITARVLEVIDSILRRPGPAPVIVLHGDHGPGSMWDWKDLDAANTHERMRIFSAYRLPGDDPPALSPQISPVNGLRLVANRYFGTRLPALPDLSFASTWDRPYRLIAVRDDEHAEVSASRRQH